PLPHAPPPRGPRSLRKRLGTLRQQSPRQVLPAHRPRPRRLARGIEAPGALRRGTLSRPERHHVGGCRCLTSHGSRESAVPRACPAAPSRRTSTTNWPFI